MVPAFVLQAYGLSPGSTTVEAFGNGLINHTWKLVSGENEFILQRINDRIFVDPAGIARNIDLIAGYLQQHHPEYKFVAAVLSIDGHSLVYHEGEGYFRLFPFVKNSHSKNVVET